MSTGPVGDALHADAEAARAEIRAAGLICPSCGVNMADAPEDHLLPYDTLTAKSAAAKCNYGQSIPLADATGMTDAEFATWRAAANFAMYDSLRKSEAEAFARIMGVKP